MERELTEADAMSDSKRVMHPLTLAFPEPATEEAFREEYFWAQLGYGRFCHFLAAFYFVGFGLLELVFIPDIGRGLLLPRFGAGLIWGVGLALSYASLSIYKKIWQPLFAFYVVWAGIAYLWMMRLVGAGAAVHVFPGLAIVLFFGFAVIRLRFVWALASGTVVVLAFPLASLGLPPEAVRLSVTNFLYLVGLAGLGALIAYRLEYLVRRDFLRNHELSKEWLKVHDAKRSLADLVVERTGELEGKSTALEVAEEESRRLQDQLDQARKLEAIGRLAGGVAHDFNNLLTIINTHAEMALMGKEGMATLREDLQGILDAGTRAADLTRQLLAFSRKQLLKPELLDLNQVATELLKMLERILPEDIILQTELGAGLPLVFVDRTQIEQVLLNLAVNARDAMPGGGTLTLETRGVDLAEDDVDYHPEMSHGPHVLITISDTGMGMDEETKAQVFEPFFTTKELGKGTGLGLSTAFGIVKQSGGNIWVYSEVGKGTTFKVLFPVAVSEADEGPRDRPAPVASGGSEVIFVAEDDHQVRKAAERVLTALGYSVLATAGGLEGLDRFRESGLKPDLLLTDVVMPGMNGLELARALRVEYPEVKVLFMSGYTSNAIAHKGILDPGIELLDKPFTRAELAAGVRAALEAPLRPI